MGMPRQAALVVAVTIVAAFLSSRAMANPVEVLSGLSHSKYAQCAQDRSKFEHTSEGSLACPLTWVPLDRILSTQYHEVLAKLDILLQNVRDVLELQPTALLDRYTSSFASPPPLHSTSMLLLTEKSSINQLQIRFSVAIEQGTAVYDCTAMMQYSGTASCSVSDAEQDTIQVPYTVKQLSSHAQANTLQILQVTFKGSTKRMKLWTLPSLQSDATMPGKTYLISLQSHVSEHHINDKRIFGDAKERTGPESRFSSKAVALVSGVVLAVMATVAVALVLVNGSKSISKSPSGNVALGTDHEASSSGSMSPGGTPSSAGFAPGQSPSTSSPFGNAASPGTSPSTGGGVISSALARGSNPNVSMENLLGNVVGNSAASATMGSRPASKSPSRNEAHGTARLKKTEKVTLLDTAVLLGGQKRGPAVVANQLLANLPRDPNPKPKPKYSQDPSSPVIHPPAKYQVHLNDLLTKNTRKTTTNRHAALSVGSAGDEDYLESFADPEEKDRMGDADGPSTLFAESDDEWIDCVVYPEPQDPIHLNDESYVEIDLEKLDYVPEPTPDTSTQPLAAHIEALATPVGGGRKKKKKKSHKAPPAEAVPVDAEEDMLVAAITVGVTKKTKHLSLAPSRSESVSPTPSRMDISPPPSPSPGGDPASSKFGWTKARPNNK